MAEGEEQDDAQKTEEPTPKKLEEAKKKGQVALSREVNNWVMLLVGTILIMSVADSMCSDLSAFMRVFIERAHDISSAGVALSNSLKEVGKILLLPLLILMVAAFLAPFVQIGPIFSAESIKPSLSKISPIKGFKRLFSKKSLMEFIKGVLKIGIISMISVIILAPYFGNAEHMIGLPIIFVLDELHVLAIRVMLGILVVLIVIAVIDLIFQRSEQHKKMRMTKQEVKDEYKQTEGDPHVKARLRSLRSERARQRMIQSVPEADVVITNPTHYSIALKYKPGEMEAPVCVAKGLNDIAFKIREVAKENNIEIYENPPLARTLYDVVGIDEAIPEDQYKAVAEIISFVFKKKGRGGA